MYASNWIFTLYTNSVPMSVSHYFLSEFFRHGWPFFYRFTLTYLQVLSSRILNIDECDNYEMVELIKAPSKHYAGSQETNTDALAYSINSQQS